MAKSMQHKETGELKRVSNSEAKELYNSGNWNYIGKYDHKRKLEQGDDKPKKKHVSIVRSSNGNIRINSNTGIVLNIELFDGGELPDILQFDLPKDKEDEYDILDLGFWLTNGKYVKKIERS